MSITIHDVWVVYYTMFNFSPSLNDLVIYLNQEEAETSVVESQKEDANCKAPFMKDANITYHVCTLAEWIQIISQYQYREGERAEREYNEPE